MDIRDSFHTFSIDGRSLIDLGAVIRKHPFHVIALRDIDMEEIHYKSGDVLVDNGRYKNIELKIPIRTIPALCDLSLQDFTYRLSAWLFSGVPEYKIYRDTYNPGYFRKGVVTSISEVSAVYRGVYECEITIKCDPFLYSDMGAETTRYSAEKDNGTYIVDKKIYNPEQWESPPIITITGQGDFYCNISGQGIIATGVEAAITFDKIAENVYDNAGNNYNSHVSTLRLPTLKPGNNIIHIESSNHFFLEITPNWRRL